MFALPRGEQLGREPRLGEDLSIRWWVWPLEGGRGGGEGAPSPGLKIQAGSAWEGKIMNKRKDWKGQRPAPLLGTTRPGNF